MDKIAIAIFVLALGFLASGVTRWIVERRRRRAQLALRRAQLALRRYSERLADQVDGDPNEPPRHHMKGKTDRAIVEEVCEKW